MAVNHSRMGTHCCTGSDFNMPTAMHGGCDTTRWSWFPWGLAPVLDTSLTQKLSSFVHPYGGTHAHNPSKESITQLEFIPMTLSCQKPFSCPISFHNNDSYMSSTCNRANRHYMVVFITDSFSQNLTAHTLHHPKNRYRKWISCRGVCVSPHQFSPHMNRFQAGCTPQ